MVHPMSQNSVASVNAPALGPAVAVAVLGIPALVVFVLAVVLNWGR